MRELELKRGGTISCTWILPQENKPESKGRYEVSIDDGEDVACIYVYDEEL